MNPAAALPAAPAPEIQAVREGYRAGKAAVLEQLRVEGSFVRGVRPMLQALSQRADEALRALWQGAGVPAGLALVAVGGFGRGELFPHSDVDVLVLAPDGLALDQDPRLKRTVEDFIGSCWDAGLEIGRASCRERVWIPV